jgi:very-short-patch-repair endonuclease
MRGEPTLAEKRLWALLRGGRVAGLKFRRQVPLGPYIADFACFDARLIVEADGAAHQNPDYDAARDAWFAANFFKVLRVRNEDVFERPERVVAAIKRITGRA